MSQSNSLPDIKSIFGRALELDSQREREAYLAAACADAPEMRAEVNELLAMHDGAKGFMPRPAVALHNESTADIAPFRDMAGTMIGPYKLLQVIGEGGMGVVYMAEQEKPVRRKVALKIIKPGMDSKQVIARFEAERQALAMMDHANIARVLDAGTTDKDLPYFVMELVQGVPITDYCDANQLSPRERLELFVPVCRAIQHAHQKGIIHRDVKPSNVLVTLYDDKPVPKVIDFGVAKAVESRLTEKTLFTQYGAMVGTFEYMSPEQADMNALGVDTRSDVYSLGVLLYEMLTGTTPLDREQLREAAFGEIVRRIKEEEPPRPSIRLSTSASIGKVAEARQSDPAKLTSLVRGELDWIVMRCLEKDRKRRYDGANDLAKDVERYLADEQVEACPPTLSYQFRKTFRRHRGAILTASAFAAILLLATGTSLWFGVSATRARNQAFEAEQVAQEQRDKAKAATADAEAVTDFVMDSIFAAADPNVEGSRDITLKEVLDQSLERLEEQFPKSSLVEASIKLRLGKLCEDLKENRWAAPGWPLIVETRKIREQLLEPDHPDVLTALETEIQYDSEFAGSLEKRRRLYELSKSRFGEDHANTLRARGMVLAVEIYLARNEPEKLKEYEQDWMELRAVQRAMLGRTHPDVLSTEDQLAYLYNLQGNVERMVEQNELGLNLAREAFGDRHVRIVESMKWLARSYSESGNYEKAEELARQALELGEEMFSQNSAKNNELRRVFFSVLVGQRNVKQVNTFLSAEMAHAGFRRFIAQQRLGVFQVWTGDLEAHHELCEQLLEEYSASTDVNVAKHVGRICLISPKIDPEQLKTLAEMVSRAQKTNASNTLSQQEHRWFTIVRAMAEYRRKDYQKANELLESLFRPDGTVSDIAGGHWLATTLAFRAMCQEEMGNHDRASALLAECRVPEKTSNSWRNSPSTGLIVRLAHQEATELIERSID